MQKSTRIAAVATAAALLTVSSASAALVQIDAASISGPTNMAGQFTDLATISDITVGSATLAVVETVSSVANVTANDAPNGTWAFGNSSINPGSFGAALVGDRVDTVAANTITADLLFDRPIAAGESFYVLEAVPSRGVPSDALDDFLITALSGGTPVGTTLAINAATLGGSLDIPEVGVLDAPERDGGTMAVFPFDLAISGITFDPSDFGLSVGDSIDGLRIADADGAFDPIGAGIAVVPEPTSAGVIALGGMLLLARRTRD
ncbi:MAG: hypothetical protein AAF656_04150 [Planctomycetota bacterium]